MGVSSLVIELTNQCNLSCNHCFRKKNSFPYHLPIQLIEKIIRESKSYSIREVHLTGGEPTLHPQFRDILKLFSCHQYRIKIVSNGNNLYRISRYIVRFRDSIYTIVFSLDGAKEVTHDRNRGAGSYKKVMEAIDICKKEKIPFSLHMTVTRINQMELEEMARTMQRLGARHLFFSHLQLTCRVASKGLDLSPLECILIERKVMGLQRDYGKRIRFCMGFYVSNPTYRCQVPLRNFNIDNLGNINYCTQLSNLEDSSSYRERVGNLNEIHLSDGYQRILKRFALFYKEKTERLTQQRLNIADRFTCWYCSKYFGKARKIIRSFPDSPWVRGQWL